MQTLYIEPEKLAPFVTDLMALQRVFGPVLRDGVYACEWLSDASNLALPPSGMPRVSAKEALLPRTEVLFYCKVGRNTEKTVPPPPPEPQLLFGVHPCDVQGVAVLDAVFSAEPFPDQPYMARRAATTVVGLGVHPDAAAPSCFFEKLGISSMDHRGCDLFLVPLSGGGYALELLSEKAAALGACTDKLAAAAPDVLAEVAALRSEAASRATREFDIAAIRDRLKTMFDSALWEEMAEKCVGCGACAFLCPTCHCFDIQDEVCGNVGCRVRNWDTCQFSMFTKHASGHNPRDSQLGRARQRIMHKFEYGFSNFGIPFCIGCGRCVEVCPVHNDLRTALSRIVDGGAVDQGSGEDAAT